MLSVDLDSIETINLKKHQGDRNIEEPMITERVVVDNNQLFEDLLLDEKFGAHHKGERLNTDQNDLMRLNDVNNDYGSEAEEETPREKG